MNVLTRKAWRDVRRRWARTLFTIATIAAAVAGLSLFAVTSLLDQAAERRVVRDRLHDIQLRTEDTALSSAELKNLQGLPGVVAVDARTTYRTRMRVGNRRVDGLLVGVRDFDDQPVDLIDLIRGHSRGRGKPSANVRTRAAAASTATRATWSRSRTTGKACIR